MITADYIIRVAPITESVNPVFTSPPSCIHTTMGDDFALHLSSYLLSVTTILVAVLGVCCRRSLHLCQDLAPNQVTFGSSSGHLVTRSKFTRIGHSSGQSTGHTETSWCDLQDMIRPVMREGKLLCFLLSLLGHENHHSVTSTEFR